MPVIKRTATSKEMKKNIKVVQRMTNGMKFDENMKNVNWKVVRKICDFGYTFMPKEKGVKFKKVDLNGISAILSIPEEVLSEGLVLYIHGGGLVSGSAKVTKGYCSMLAKASGCRVFSIDYRLAPENVYPAAVDDCFTAYKELQRLYPNSKIAITGESGGGLLCFALTIRCIENNVVPPACIVAHSGGFDFTETLVNSKTDYVVDDYTVKKGAHSAAMGLYAPNQDLHNPELSPYFYNRFSEFPPVVFTCDSKELIKVDSIETYKKMEEAGVDVTLYEYENTFHAFAPIGTMSPETTELLKENSAFMRKYIG